MKANGSPGVQPEVLLIEDDEAHAHLVIRGFIKQKLSNKIRHLTNGEMALDYLHHRGDYADSSANPHPCLILLDLRIPKVDGLEVLREIKSDDSLRYLPVVILTSSDAEKDIAQAYEYHANSYLVKPLDFVKFTKMLSDLGEYWLDWNTMPFQPNRAISSKTGN